jgi:diguanylate cyclase (GGDEF)-like protein
MHLMSFGLSRSSRLLSRVVALLIVVATAAAIVVAVDLRREARARAEHDTNRLALVLAQQMSRLLENVDLVLTGIDRDMGLARLNTPGQFGAVLGTQVVHQELMARRTGLPMADALVVIDADGTIVGSSRAWPPAPVSLDDRAYFRAIRVTDSPALYISEPVLNRVTGNWTVSVLRRVAAPDGTFLGAVAAAVRLKYLEDFFTSIDLPTGMAVTLLRRDGLVLADSPPTRRLNTKFMPAASAWYPSVAADGGEYWSPGWLDGEPRRVSVRPVPGFPVVVDVSLTRQAVYAGWWRQVEAIAIGTVCVVVCLLLLLAGLVAQFRRLETTQAALRRKSVLLETTLANMEQGLIMITADRTIGVVNERALSLLDLPAELMREGLPVDDVLDYQWERGEFDGQDLDMLALRLGAGFPDRSQVHQRHRPNGTVLEIRSVPLRDGGTVRTYTDITERMVAQERIIHAAQHDMLTCLPNRATFTERLTAEIALAQRLGTGLAVLFLDLDRFKLVNDTLGHSAGDELLRQVADRMRRVVREADTLARMGGDEFALVMPDMPGPEAAVAIAKRLREAMHDPFRLARGTASIGVSIGIACHPAHGGSADELLNHADLALYRTKTAGRDGWCVFDAGLDTHEHDVRVLQNEMSSALRDEQFAVAYQPIWEFRTQRIVGAEALVRWHHPLKGVIPPSDFIPLAERTGLIVDLGRWVLEAACREAVSWARPIVVSVNVAPAQLRRPEFIDELRQALAATGLPPSRLKLEVTETQLLEETAEMLATMTTLRELGVRLSLDDFGTGYSSLSALRSFPFSDVKIDRGFTRGIVGDERSRNLVESILQVCRVLNLECVAEGVETHEQLEMLQSMGCSHAQGYLIGRPEPPTTIRRMLWGVAAEHRHDPPRPPADADAVVAL